MNPLMLNNHARAAYGAMAETFSNVPPWESLDSMGRAAWGQKFKAGLPGDSGRAAYRAMSQTFPRRLTAWESLDDSDRAHWMAKFERQLTKGAIVGVPA